MLLVRFRLPTLIGLLLRLTDGVSACAVAANWPQFRGAQASGVGETSVPTTWDIESGENVRWQTPIPGLAHASPIIWGDRVYVATAVKRS